MLARVRACQPAPCFSISGRVRKGRPGSAFCNRREFACQEMPSADEHDYASPVLFVFLTIFYLIFYLRPSFISSSHSRSSDPGSHSMFFSSLCTAVRALHFFIARRLQSFLPSSTRVELRLRTLHTQLILLFFLQNYSKSHHVTLGFELRLAALEGDHY